VGRTLFVPLVGGRVSPLSRWRCKGRALRRGVLGDLDDIVRIERLCFADGAWKVEDLEKQFDYSFAKILVFDDSFGESGEPPSAVGFLLFWETGDEVQLMRLGVEPHFQGQGIGSMLLNHLVTESDRRRTYTLEVRESNDGARTFYRRLGFNDIAVRQRYYSDGENAILMQRRIEEVVEKSTV